VTFSDDPLLTDEKRARLQSRRGGSGEVLPSRDTQGIWHVQRDIMLRQNIPENR
jgi:hypothetical protein